MRVKPLRLGVVFGLLLAIFHAFWAILVALRWAQPLMDFVFWAHFIAPAWHIEAFTWERACVLVGFTVAVGLVIGAIGGWLWNRLTSAD